VNFSNKTPSLECEGFVHSVETCGTVDGPGLRYVIFLTGCPLRCVYCHNPDTQQLKNGKVTTARETVRQVLRYKSFIRNGGVTISGGEPLTQQLFVESVLREVKKNQLHTALDTSGCFGVQVSPSLLDLVDLVLLDIKAWTNEDYLSITGKSVTPVLEFAKLLERLQKPTWIRFVLVPRLTDREETIHGIAAFVQNMKNVERVEVLPFHKYGESKYKELGLKYTLSETQPPSEERTEEVREIFRSYGLLTY